MWRYPDFAYRCLPSAYRSRGRSELRGKITKRAVDALTIRNPRHDREVLWDTEISGFGVVAFPTGKKVYVAQYRKDGRSRRLTLGDHGRLAGESADARKGRGSGR